MLLPKKISNTKKSLLTGLIVIILAAMAYLIYTNFLVGMIPLGFAPRPAVLEREIVTFAAPAVNTEINADFTGQAPYTNLKDSSVTVTVDQLGRPDPFAIINYVPPAPKK